MTELIQLGSIYRPHGVKGMMKVKVDPLYMDELLGLKAIFLQTKVGNLPYFIQSVEAISDDMALLQLEDIDTKEKAAELVKAPLMAESEVLDIVTAEEWSDVVGYILFDKQMGIIGPIDHVLEMPQQVLAEVHYQGKDILVPLHDDLILEVDALEKKVIMNLPEGYFDIFSS
jgi:16S rRNA processing protein RimM